MAAFDEEEETGIVFEVTKSDSERKWSLRVTFEESVSYDDFIEAVQLFLQSEEDDQTEKH